MALEKRVVVDQVEVTQNNTVQVRMCKQIVDGDVVMASEYHRTALLHGVDIEAQLLEVNAHLDSMGYPPVTGWGRVVRLAQAAWE